MAAAAAAADGGLVPLVACEQLFYNWDCELLETPAELGSRLMCDQFCCFKQSKRFVECYRDGANGFACLLPAGNKHRPPESSSFDWCAMLQFSQCRADLWQNEV